MPTPTTTPVKYAIKRLYRDADGRLRYYVIDANTGVILSSMEGYTLWQQGSNFPFEPEPETPDEEDPKDNKEEYLGEPVRPGPGDNGEAYGPPGSYGPFGAGDARTYGSTTQNTSNTSNTGNPFSVERTRENNYGYIPSSVIEKGAKLAPGVIGTIATVVDAGRRANNISAINAARADLGLPAMTASELAKSAVKDDFGYVGSVVVKDSIGRETIKGLSLDPTSSYQHPKDILDDVTNGLYTISRPATEEENKLARDSANGWVDIGNHAQMLRDYQFLNSPPAETTQIGFAGKQGVNSLNPLDTFERATPRSGGINPTAGLDKASTAGLGQGGTAQGFNSPWAGHFGGFAPTNTNAPQSPASDDLPSLGLSEESQGFLGGVTGKTQGLYNDISSVYGDLGINSGFRTKEENEAVGGATSSQHLGGNAIDINTKGMSAQQRESLLSDLAKDPRVGGVGLYPSGAIHADTRNWSGQPSDKAIWGSGGSYTKNPPELERILADPANKTSFPSYINGGVIPTPLPPEARPNYTPPAPAPATPPAAPMDVPVAQAPAQQQGKTLGISVGSNNYTNPQVIAKDMQRIAEKARAAGYEPVFIAPSPSLIDFNTGIKVVDIVTQVAQSLGAKVEVIQEFAPDGIHPSQREYARLAEVFAGVPVIGDSIAQGVRAFQGNPLPGSFGQVGATTRAVFDRMNREGFFGATAAQGAPTQAGKPSSVNSGGAQAPTSQFGSKVSMGVGQGPSQQTVGNAQLSNNNAGFTNSTQGSYQAPQGPQVSAHPLATYEDTLAHMIAGELGSKTLEGLVSTDPATVAAARNEVAAILSTVENRAKSIEYAKSQNPVLDVIDPSKYNSLSNSNIPVTDANYSKYGKEITQAVKDYVQGRLESPVPGATHYYNPDALKAQGKPPPSWANLGKPTPVGQHTFFTGVKTLDGSRIQYQPSDKWTQGSHTPQSGPGQSSPTSISINFGQGSYQTPTSGVQGPQMTGSQQAPTQQGPMPTSGGFMTPTQGPMSVEPVMGSAISKSGGGYDPLAGMVPTPPDIREKIIDLNTPKYEVDTVPTTTFTVPGTGTTFEAPIGSFFETTRDYVDTQINAADSAAHTTFGMNWSDVEGGKLGRQPTEAETQRFQEEYNQNIYSQLPMSLMAPSNARLSENVETQGRFPSFGDFFSYPIDAIKDALGYNSPVATPQDFNLSSPMGWAERNLFDSSLLGVSKFADEASWPSTVPYMPDLEEEWAAMEREKALEQQFQDERKRTTQNSWRDIIENYARYSKDDRWNKSFLGAFAPLDLLGSYNRNNAPSKDGPSNTTGGGGNYTPSGDGPGNTTGGPGGFYGPGGDGPGNTTGPGGYYGPSGDGPGNTTGGPSSNNNGPSPGNNSGNTTGGGNYGVGGWSGDSWGTGFM